MLNLLLARHAQSEWNALGRWQGQSDPPLSELGWAQARAAGLNAGVFDAIVASTLERARNTATVISEATGVGPVLIDERLMERQAGEYQGLTKDQIESRWPGNLAARIWPPGWEFDDDLVARARKGEGPFFMELMTYRYHGHHVGDINREYYRSKDEEKDWKENRDPIIRFRAHLVSEGLATEEEIDAMNAEIAADADAAVKYALDAKYPDVSEVDMHVFTDVKHALA